MNAKQKMTSARTTLVLYQPFFGALALRLALQPDPGCGTAWVDGRTLGYDPAFIEPLSHDQLVGLIAHEVMHCFPAGTLVAGDDKAVEDFVAGNEVLGRNGEKCRVVRTSTRAFEGDLVTIKARAMLGLEVTDGHPVLVSRPRWRRRNTTNVREWSEPAWKPAGELVVGDWLCVPMIHGTDETKDLRFEFGNPWSVSEQIRNGVTLDEEIAEFVGWYVAEGWTTRTGKDWRIGFALGDHEQHVAERLVSILSRRFGLSATVRPHPRARGLVVSACSAPLGRWLRKACGAGARHKRFPEAILYHREAAILRSCLRAYIAGDGSVGNAVGFCTASKVLALQVQLAFARFGALVNLYERQAVDGEIRGRSFRSGLLYHGQGQSQAAFDALDEPRKVRRPTSYCGRIGNHLMTPVIAVSRRRWSGHVYNFSTESETYTAGNFVVHNCALGHPWRRGGRDHEDWNVAADFAINGGLSRAGFKLPDGGMVNPKFDGKSAEWIYSRLPAKKKDPSQGPGKPKPNPLGEVRDAPSEAQAEGATETDWQLAVQQAAQAAHARGQLPQELRRLVQEAVAPRVDWRAVLRRFVQQLATADYSWSRPNARYLPMGIYLPSLRSEALGPIVVAVDTSGSIDRVMLEQFAGELRAIADESKPERIVVMYCDAHVNRTDVFERGDMIELEPVGGGGTRFEPVFEAVSEMEEAPACVVYLTDLDGSFPERAPEIPTLWASTRPGEVSFGEVVVIQ